MHLRKSIVSRSCGDKSPPRRGRRFNHRKEGNTLDSNSVTPSWDTKIILRAMNSKYDVVVIGGGHNGLVNAAYLARAGKKGGGCQRKHVAWGPGLKERS